ncbi:MAG: hypothetical protein WCQ48_01420 [Chloroflexota bacterium]
MTLGDDAPVDTGGGSTSGGTTSATTTEQGPTTSSGAATQTTTDTQNGVTSTTITDSNMTATASTALGGGANSSGTQDLVSTTMSAAPGTFTVGTTVVFDVVTMNEIQNNPAFAQAFADALGDAIDLSAVVLDNIVPGANTRLRDPFNDIALTRGPLAPTEVIATAESAKLTVLKAFEMSGKSPGGALVQPGKPISLTLDVSPTTLASAAGRFGNIFLLAYDPTTRKWDDLPQAARTDNTVTFTIPHFSLFAYVVRGAAAAPQQAAPAATPAVATAAAPAAIIAAPEVAPRPANTGTGIPSEATASPVLSILLGVLGIGILGSVGLRTVRRHS